MDPCKGAGLVSALVAGVAAAWLAGSSLARASRAVTMAGVVSVMVVAESGLPHGGVPDDLDVERVEQFGLQAGRQAGQVGGHLGQQANQVGGGGRGGIGGEFGELRLDVLTFAVQGRVVGADAAAVLFAGLHRACRRSR